MQLDPIRLIGELHVKLYAEQQMTAALREKNEEQANTIADLEAKLAKKKK